MKSANVRSVEIVEREHRCYMLKAGTLQGTVIARAFPKPPSKFSHLVAEASGKTTEDAIEQLIAKLEALRLERRSLRRADPSLATGVPTADEYADALRSLSLGPKLLGVLHDHALSRGRGRRLADLAVAGEFSSVPNLLAAYERLGNNIFNVIEPDEVLDAGLPVVMQVPDDNDGISGEVGVLQPELQEALFQLMGSQRLTG